MFKPELWQSHDEYQTMVNRIGHRLSRNNPKYFLLPMRKNGRCFLTSAPTRLLNTSLPFIHTPAGPLLVRAAGWIFMFRSLPCWQKR